MPSSVGSLANRAHGHPGSLTQVCLFGGGEGCCASPGGYEHACQEVFMLCALICVDLGAVDLALSAHCCSKSKWLGREGGFDRPRGCGTGGG